MGIEEKSWWRRVRSSDDGFRYLKVDGKPLVSESALARIEELAIPPAWTDVHIAPRKNRKIQAWGVDAAGRRQYIYSEAHQEEQDRKKWGRVQKLAERLPDLRAATNRDLKRSELDRRKVLATVVRLMSRGFFRIGNERYAEENDSYGIATLRREHLEIRGNDLIFSYPGKRQQRQRRVLAETPLVEILEELTELAGPRLFKYRDEDGELRPVTARRVNEYLQEILGERFSSKDLRTLGGTVRAATVLADIGPADSERKAHKNVVLCCRMVAAELGNTPAICRSSYVHPAVLDEYEEHGRTIEHLMRSEPRPLAAEAPVEYYPEEAALMRFLEKYG